MSGIVTTMFQGFPRTGLDVTRARLDQTSRQTIRDCVMWDSMRALEDCETRYQHGHVIVHKNVSPNQVTQYQHEQQRRMGCANARRIHEFLRAAAADDLVIAAENGTASVADSDGVSVYRMQVSPRTKQVVFEEIWQPETKHIRTTVTISTEKTAS